MRKILHVTPDFNFALNFVRPICIEQIKSKCHVTVISTMAYYTKSEVNESSLLVDTFDKNISNLKLVILNLRFRNFNLRLVKSYFRYVKMIIDEQFDLIIFHTSIDSLLPMLISRIFSKRTKRVYFNHGLPSLGYSGFAMHVLRLVEKVNIRLSISTFTIGPSMANALLEINQDSKIIYNPPGSACGIELISNNYQYLKELRKATRLKHNISVDKKVVLYVGRPVKRKGIYDLLDAWNAFSEDNSYLLWLIGPNEKELSNISLPDNVMALGYLSDLKDFYLISDVLCVPSYHEGFGYTYLEAAACGCVPICSNIPGPTDFVTHNLTGLTVSPKSVFQIKNSIETLFMDSDKLNRLSCNAFEKSQQFDRKTIAPKISKMLLDITRT